MDNCYLIVASDGTVAKLNPVDFNALADTHEKWEMLRNRACKITNPKTLSVIKKLLEE